MNLQEFLFVEHSKKQAIAVAHWACSHPKNCDLLINCFLGSDVPVAERAAWSVGWVAKENIDILFPYLDRFVEQLTIAGTTSPIIRNIVLVLERIQVPPHLEGILMNTCFEFIMDPTQAPAIKAYSLSILYHLSKKYPEIREELACIIEERWDTETAAFRSRGRKILAAIKKP